MKKCMQVGGGILLLCFAAFGLAEDESYHTDWLSPEEGFEESKMGARIHSVTHMEEEGMHRIHISLPESEQAIEEVIVVGERIDQPEIEQAKRFEFINDLQTGRHGVVIYVGKREKFALRFNYDEGDARFPYD